MSAQGIHHWVAIASHKAAVKNARQRADSPHTSWFEAFIGNLQKLRGPARFEGRVKWFSLLLRFI